jgi:RNA methyltransferase, TrmH family
MISKNKAAYIVSLQKKKTRDEEKLFVIEGDKLVREFLEARAGIKTLVALPEFLNSLPIFLREGIDEVLPVSPGDLERISSLKTPHNALAVVHITEKKFDYSKVGDALSVALDSVQDPGNMGTIIRSAAWFGIRNIFCSPECADLYNPKVIQSSMGAILHVNVFSIDLKEFFSRLSEEKIKVFGAVLEGNSIYAHKLENKGVILLGNESRGISDDLMPFVTDRIMIPGRGADNPGIDSLNVSMAASVILSEFTRSRGREF